MSTFYRVHYIREIGSCVVEGSIDMTQEHVETTHEGCIETAVLDSTYQPEWSRITGWELVTS
jgi:hypothetical protein